MAPIVPLTYYSVIILAASVFGGMLPLWFRLTHRGMQVAVSFVAAMMFGVGMLHMLPHALSEAHAVKASADEAVDFTVMMWVVAGWLTMFFIERFFCYHHHDLETDAAGELHELHEHQHDCGHDHGHHHHDITWSGAAFGLTIHSVIEGVALAASVYHRHDNLPLAGLGTFLVIFLHKPFDSMTIAMLMARGGWSPQARYAVNGLFALAIPVGIVLFFLGMGTESSSGPLLAYSLAFSAGTFLCISLSDLLPELQFHDHDRGKLSLALLLGLALALGVGKLESLVHRHSTAAAATASALAPSD
ncbi:ZIP family metal transporter [Lacipirellula limnantheis]|uniref:Zinc transporter ZupT n=1 Tax=Lacipirellula limnantheis TaxID=2528024 RepID=A0A517U2Q1_9BACT|nr:ZIP family metal transporter [Lacipirellula limnantheis]QDT74883.1 zinc transporter ZupT [Lacipirellula limnantheis]